MMEDNDWLKGLQSKMKDYEEPAPEGLWENIESSVFPEKKRRVIALPILWRSVGVAAAVAWGGILENEELLPYVESALRD